MAVMPPLSSVATRIPLSRTDTSVGGTFSWLAALVALLAKSPCYRGLNVSILKDTRLNSMHFAEKEERQITAGM